MDEYMKFHKNGGSEGLVLTTRQPITGQQGITLTFRTDKEVSEFHKKLGDFLGKEENVDTKWILNALDDCIKNVQKIRFICERAKTHGVDEKDVDEILELLK